MSDGEKNLEQGFIFERHAQTALTVLVVGLLAWVGLTTQSTAVRVAELDVKVESIIDGRNARVDDLTRRIEIIERDALDRARNE